jgi:hypothetical protein
MTHADGYGISRALAGGPDECGDEGILEIREDCCFLALVDALGHGRNAHGVARLARECLTGRGPEEDLPGLMRELHERLRGTTGAVVALCRVFPADGRVSHVGIGNVTARVLGPRPFTFLSRDGVVGYRMPSPTERTRTLLPGEVLILHSTASESTWTSWSTRTCSGAPRGRSRRGTWSGSASGTTTPPASS